jgi:hypothetical protein
VRFAPNAVGAASAAVTFTDNAANSPQTIKRNRRHCPGVVLIALGKQPVIRH